jgi:hypothetical protein
MRIKRQLSAALFVLVTQACMAQTSTPDIIASSGGYQSNASGSLSWTLGEPLIETGTSSNNYLTQGFQQPSGITISSTDNVTKPNASVTAYPNPSSSLVYVNSTTTTSMQAEVYDLAGQRVYKKTISGDDNELNLGNLTNGMYLLKVFTAEGQLLQTMKLEKVK